MSSRNIPRSPEEFEAERRLLLERWPDGKPKCPKCNCATAYDIRRRDGHPRWRCKSCKKEFSLTSGTPWAFHKKSHLEMSAPPVHPKAMVYPFMPKRSSCKGSDIVLAVNDAVPRTLPSEIRSDVCQELALEVLAGRSTTKGLRGRVEVIIRRVKDDSGFIEYALSLDGPAPGVGTDDFHTGATTFYEAAMDSALRIEPDEATWAGEFDDCDLPDVSLWTQALREIS